MRLSCLAVALLLLPKPAFAQLEMGGYMAVGQRWHDGGRTFAGGALTIGARTSAARPGIGFGIRLGATLFGAEDPNPHCALTCDPTPHSYTLSVRQASMFLIPVRIRGAELEVGLGTSVASAAFESDVSALLLNAAFSVPMGNDTRMHLAFDRQVRPNQADMIDYRERFMFRNLVRLGLVYAPRNRPSR